MATDYRLSIADQRLLRQLEKHIGDYPSEYDKARKHLGQVCRDLRSQDHRRAGVKADFRKAFLLADHFESWLPQSPKNCLVEMLGFLWLTWWLLHEQASTLSKVPSELTKLPWGGRDHLQNRKMVSLYVLDQVVDGDDGSPRQRWMKKARRVFREVRARLQVDPPPPPSLGERLHIDRSKEVKVVALDGNRYPLTNRQVEILDALIAANGGWVSGDRLKSFSGSEERPDRIISKLPEAVKKLILSKRGSGYRISL